VSGTDVGLLLAVFFACAVEAVEALTIVLAVGIERDMRSALTGVVVAILILAILVAALGPAVRSIPLGTLRVLIGGLLLVFGLSWLRKAILRQAGRKALHDEAALFARQSEAARRAGAGRRLRGDVDAYAFFAAFKGTLLEGLEVVFIIVTFGDNQHDLPGAAVAAGAAVLLVALLGYLARGPLTRLPENAVKFGVGVLLTAFGMFWATEGAGAHWPGNDLALVVLIPGIALFALAYAARLRATPVGAAA
jgi:uncharacterized membrane protein